MPLLARIAGALVAVHVASCAVRATPPVTSPPRTVAPGPEMRDHVEEIADVEDRCPMLPPECLEGFDFVDHDGCPDPPPPTFSLPSRASAIPEAGLRLLNYVAADVPHLIARATLVIVVEAAPGEPASETGRRADLVVAALLARVSGAFVAVEPGGAIVHDGRDLPPEPVQIRVDGCRR